MYSSLTDILEDVNVLEIQGPKERKVRNVVFDSRHVNSDDLFVALRGTQKNGHTFIQKALEGGAVAVLCEEIPAQQDENITWIKTDNSSRALALVASAFYGHPSRSLKLAGITGTNGKTTIVTLLYKLFRKLDYKAGLLSTVRNYIDNQELEATHTTPDAISINRLLKQMVDEGCEFAFMEVSSHAIDQNRITGLSFDVALFTNITHDHLDYHKSFRNYLEAKKNFFDQLPEQAKALVNYDDRNGPVMLQNTVAQKYTYALKKPADFKGKILENNFTGLQMEIDGIQVWTRLVGDFNAFNLMAVYGTAYLLGAYREDILVHLSALQAAEGRFEVLQSEHGVSAIVDYAHTPDALENVVKTIDNVRSKEQQLIVVIGAGGDRDHGKRSVMAEIVAKYGQKIIFTSDNPRSEDPQQIIEDMKTGLPGDMKNRLLEISDRKQAITTAFMLAEPGDIVLVAGKGHETYQEVNGVKHHFDDKEIIRSIIENQ